MRVAVLDEPGGEAFAVEPFHREVELQLDEPAGRRIVQAEAASSAGSASACSA